MAGRLGWLRQFSGRQRNCSSLTEFPEDLVRLPLFSGCRTSGQRYGSCYSEAEREFIP